jgi:hypothetical protein
MATKSAKRERILHYIRGGDPEKMPVMIGPSFELPAAYLGKEPHEVTWAEALKVAEETGTHNIACVSSPYPFNAVQSCDDITITEETEQVSPDLRRTTSRITTPEGILTAIIEFPKHTGQYHREFYVKGPEDLSAYSYFIRRTSQATVENPEVRRSVEKDMESLIGEVGGSFPSNLWVFCPAVELTCSLYMDQVTAIYLLYDYPDLFEELMAAHWEMTKVWLDIGAAHNIDIYGYSINGLEWLSVDLYERYMIPQAKLINDFAEAQGAISWVHTCGKLRKLAENRTYQRMNVKMMESLSTPMTGDIANLAETRANIGHDITTRGGINVEYFYDPNLAALRAQTEHVIDSVKGYRHMIGDTNDSYPPYPWENMKTVIDVVRSRGILYE